MPISIDEFESDGVRPRSVPERVVAFLASNRDQAFARTEIADALDVGPNVVSTALSRLDSRSLVRHRGEYWALTDDLERARAAYELHGVSEQLDTADGGIDADTWDGVTSDGPHPTDRPGADEA